MKILVNAAEVAALAFGGDEEAMCGVVDDVVIAAAQDKYLRPVLGDALLAAVGDGKYSGLLGTYLQPAIAWWVRFLALPAIHTQVGAAGVVSYGGNGFMPADDKSLRRLLRLTRGKAETLTRLLMRHVESMPEEYPEYEPENNILNRASIAGGIVL